MTITFNSAVQTAYLAQGEIRNNELIDIVQDATGIKDKLVEATRHTIISGAPGVGKTHTTLAEIEQSGKPFMTIVPGMTDLAITVNLAYRLYTLPEDEELIVVIDDADDVVFGDLKTLNRWKLATQDVEPQWAHEVDFSNTFTKLEKQGKTVEIEALKSFQEDGSIGVRIGLERVRFIVLCNTDLEDPKQLSKKLFNSVEAVIDRFTYERLEMPWQEKWGWLAYILGTTQPFEDVHLDESQKKELLVWLFSNWDNLKSREGASYRFVRKMAADMINNPTKYLDKWQRGIK